MGIEPFWFDAVADDEDVLFVGDLDVRAAFAGNKSENGGEEREDSGHGGKVEG